uniref:C3H1-type domain-containing protein n=1 Tax=Plectus sambesii TaxID=2011161 RepID=A0A914X4D6_9BILA
MKEAEKVKKEEEKAKKEGKKAAKIENRLSIVYLDNIVEEWPNTIFFNAEWNTKDIQGSLNPIPAERTIIIQFHTSPTRHTKKLAASKREIEEVTQQLGIPFYYHWTWGSSDDREYASNTASKENDGKRQLLIIFGPRESSDRIEDNMDESYLLENNYIDVEGGVKNAPKSKKLYDFTKIYLKQRDWIRQYFAKFGNVELVVDYVSFHNQASPNIPSTSYDQELTEDEGGWTLVHAKSKNKIYQRSSNPCEMGRRCPKGGKCEHKHSDEEREYFKKHPDGKIRMTRKTRICIDYCQKTEQRSGIKGCRYSKDQCNYAHGESDAYCYMCGVEGDHFACDCPENTS